MIIDCHAHVSPPSALWVHKASLLSHMGAHGSRMPEVTDAEILAAANRKEMAPKGHLDMMDQFGIDLQMLSPRPFQMMHSAKPSRLVHWFTEETNNIIARTVQLMPKRFVAVAACRRPLASRWRGCCPNWNAA
jgi:OH-DDVA meta-cleavage compound hydrolase